MQEVRSGIYNPAQFWLQNTSKLDPACLLGKSLLFSVISVWMKIKLSDTLAQKTEQNQNKKKDKSELHKLHSTSIMGR